MSSSGSGQRSVLASRGITSVVGATGAVGREVLSILAERGVPAEDVRALASERSVGTTIEYGSAQLRVRALEDGSFDGADLAIFTASADIAREWAPRAAAAGAVVVDNSSAFRMTPGVPLIVPEVNGDLLEGEAWRERGLIANPNCSTIILLMALEGLRREFGVERVHVATYQAVSGAGLAAIDELKSQARAVLNGQTAKSEVFKEQCAFNVFSHDSAIDERDGLNVEERKIIEESGKIWGSRVPLTPTCIRVPVVRAHSQAISVRLGTETTPDAAREAIARVPGVRVIDDRAGNTFPTPLKASGIDDVLVGRVRLDPAEPPTDGRSRHVCLWVCGDQLRKGAALNAVQIGDLLGRCSTPHVVVRGQSRASEIARG